MCKLLNTFFIFYGVRQMTEPNINEVKNIAMKYLKEMGIDNEIVSKIIKIITAGTFHKKDKELEESVGFADVEYIDKETNETDEICKESLTPYVIVGDAEVVQINVDEKDAQEEISWGIPCKNEFKVKCVKMEGVIDYDIFVMKRKECIADIKIIPKTPVVLVEVEEENTCWLDNRYYYLYVYPFGWWIYASKRL